MALQDDYDYLPYLLPALAAVIIVAGTWFLFIRPGYQVSPQERMNVSCQMLCDDYRNFTGVRKQAAAVDYCSRAFDLGGDPRTLEQAGKRFCSDGAHCFNVGTCSADGRTLDAATCKQVMYDYYTEVNGEAPAEAAQHVVDIFKPSNGETGVGTCDLQASWYTDNLDDPGDVRP